MNCVEIINNLGFQCKDIATGIHFFESPLTLDFDGSNIGAYIQELAQNRVRLSDNSQILFTAMTNGISHHSRRVDTFRHIAEDHGLILSENGELYVSCSEDDLPYYLIRFLEAAEKIGYLCSTYKPKTSEQFQKLIGQILKDHYDKRLSSNYETKGASGHSLKFPFVIDAGESNTKYIQTVSCHKGKPDWKSVYHALGKLTDFKNLHKSAKRIIILEPADIVSETEKVRNALNECANVIAFSGADHLIRDLAA